MADLWTTLLPLVIGSAVVPTQKVVTAVLLRSSRGKAAAWIAGMAALRVLPGALFGFVFRSRAIAVVLGAVFGTWFLLKALSALGLV